MAEKRKVGYRKLKERRIALIVMDHDQKATVQKAGARLTEKYEATVLVMDGSSAYKDWYTLANFKPHLTIFVAAGPDRCIPATVRDETRLHNRPRGYTKMVQTQMVHQIRMHGGDPYRRGVYVLPWDEIKSIPWYLKDDKPMLYIRSRLPEDQMAEVLVDGIYRYFIDLTDYLYDKQVKEDREVENCGCKNELYGTISR